MIITIIMIIIRADISFLLIRLKNPKQLAYPTTWPTNGKLTAQR